MPVVGKCLFQGQFHQFFGRQLHIFAVLPKLYHRESKSIQILLHLHCIPDLIDKKGCDKIERKHEAPPRYDAAFKEGAIRLVAEEGRPMREVAEELGVCTDTIRNWLKASGIQPKETERQNRLERRQRDLEAEIRVLPTALMALSG